MLQKYDRKMTVADLTLPVAGLGTVKLGRNTGVKYPNAFELPNDKQALDLLALAHELGIRLIDTAPAYGNSEKRLGKLLPAKPDWLICTKVGETFENGQSQFNFSAQGIKNSVQRSLTQLRRDYLDIVLIHSDGNDSHILHHTDAVQTLHQLKKDGFIRAVGLSGKTASGGIAALETFDMDIAMITHNPIYQAEKTIIDTAIAQSKAILVKKAFASGHLEQLGNNPIQRTMDCIFSNRDVAISVILGTINPVHLRENVKAINNVLLT